MRVEDDGNLSLHVTDLRPEHRRMVPRRLFARHFTREACIATWYARRANAQVTFVGADRRDLVDLKGWVP